MAVVASALASIPSPSSGRLELGPVSLNAYGLMIALGVVAAVWLFGRRLEQRHIGTREDANVIAVWGVIAGIIGARIYHVATDWELFEGDWWRVFAIWQGGLGIPGGMLAGVLVGTWAAHRRGIPLGPGLNAVAPSLPLAQAIGRWGNWFNQELYGRPTTLPWALEIDANHLPADGRYAVGTTFHPTFLYESLWDLLLCGALLWIDRKWRMANGQLLAIYVLGYGIGRLWVESLRVDATHHLFGLRWNQWVATLLIAAGGGYLLLTIGSPRERVYTEPPQPVNTDDDETAALAMATAGLDDVDGAASDRESDVEPATADRPESEPADRPDDAAGAVDEEEAGDEDAPAPPHGAAGEEAADDDAAPVEGGPRRGGPAGPSGEAG